MPDEYQLESLSDYHFILAGNAIFTLVFLDTDTRYTYRVRKAYAREDELPRWFVSLLTGSDNESSYTYIGMIFSNEAGKTYFSLTRKSHLPFTSPPVVGFNRVLRRLNNDEGLMDVEFWHAGMCGRCGRTLTVPESIATGLGPECRRAES